MLRKGYNKKMKTFYERMMELDKALYRFKFEVASALGLFKLLDWLSKVLRKWNDS